MHGSPILLGDNTIPGVQLPKELKELIPVVLQKCRDWGLDFYPTVVQLLTYDEISEIAAYGGFPVRYPHWTFGMEYEELQRGYEFGMHKIYEMVINTNPCYIFNLSSNTLLDHLLVVAHATGHNDFFKNNVYFSATDTNMINKMANHGTRIRNYMARWGKEKVTAFLDLVLRLVTLVDGADAWKEKEAKDKNISDKRHYNYPRRLNVDKDRMYMEPFLNTEDFKKRQRDNVKELDIADDIEVFKEPTRNILAYLRDNAPLKLWQADILSMIYEEAMYFYPQRQTKVINEGWASMVDSVILAEQGLASLGQKGDDHGIVEYAMHKAGVLGGKYSVNPYRLGYYLLKDIRERWDKGQFGPEWDDCKNIHEKEKWDKNTGLGKEKIFEVRKYYNDVGLIREFFTEDFCREHEYFQWKHYPNGEFRLDSRDFVQIKKSLLKKHLNGGLPDIRLTEPNYKGKGIMFLQHYSDDNRTLHYKNTNEVISAISKIWNNDVCLATHDKNGQEKIHHCSRNQDGDNVDVIDRETFLRAV